ncbi:hypothetical protein L249_7518 [Ophiocordyceps polyrhachis-furcata BCC 54312]|uniref:Ubiquitin carboxyl-terminal hydrolase n=1 Tax=Ophiocordyceps polyrhachis-furcata BCC 54312 TaxID=1330021 RepID=A0A367L9K4_9HYPO|nr:hypothetical protein L249_7518 [Ophiocordyceps polyrhachis-furcata BCC 54312]
MARRQNDPAGPGVAEPAASTATEQAIEIMAERVAEKAVIKVLDALSDRYVDALAEKLPAGIIDKIAASVAEKIAAAASAPEKQEEAGIPKRENGHDNKPPELAPPQTRSTRGGRQARKRRSPEHDDAPPEKKSRTARKARKEDTETTFTEGRSTRSRAKKANDVEAGKKAEGNTTDQDLAEDDDNSDNLLVETMKPLDDKDIEEWAGWAEVESEPAFFNFILKKFGVGGVTVRELVSLEHWALAFLPQPVYGLVFLFQYAPQLADEEDDDSGEAPVWFANQTTNNSCASVALLNIVMNANVELGQRLQSFKESTMDLSTPMRGNSIGNNSFIRTAHNSFVRRMDQLNADLCLANEADAHSPKEPRAKAAAKKTKPTDKSEVKQASSEVDYGFHFIAYVPAGGFVWELDGMRIRPRNIGALDTEDWTAIARPRIQHRIKEYGETEIAFSLLALCRSPFLAHGDTIASNLAALHRLRKAYADDATFREVVEAHPHIQMLDSEDALADFGLDASDIADAQLPAQVQQQMQADKFGSEQARNLFPELAADVQVAMAKYREELVAVAEEEDRVHSRKKDYSPALHLWMTKLAEKGVLEEVIGNSQ